jgi:hypothetical protein
MRAVKIEIITRDDYNSKTHTVLKGKTSKKVTAVKPKCPAGFKKK